MAINKTIEQIREEVLRIKNETVAKANTATRVGGALEDIVDHIEDAVEGALDDVQDVVDGVQSALASEVSRAQAKEQELQRAFSDGLERIVTYPDDTVPCDTFNEVAFATVQRVDKAIQTDGSLNDSTSHYTWVYTISRDVKVWFDTSSLAALGNKTYVAVSATISGTTTSRMRFVNNSEDTLPNSENPLSLSEGDTLMIDCSLAESSVRGCKFTAEYSSDSGTLSPDIQVGAQQINGLQDLIPDISDIVEYSENTVSCDTFYDVEFAGVQRVDKAIQTDGSLSDSSSHYTWVYSIDRDVKVWFDTSSLAALGNKTYVAVSAVVNGVSSGRLRFVNNSEDTLPDSENPLSLSEGDTLMIDCSSAESSSRGCKFTAKYTSDSGTLSTDIQVEAQQVKGLQQMYLKKTASQFDIYIKNKAGYIHYPLVHATKPYQGETTDAAFYDCWGIKQVSQCDTGLNEVETLFAKSEAEVASVVPNYAGDNMAVGGSVHGYENVIEEGGARKVIVLIDGSQVAEDAVIPLSPASCISITQQTELCPVGLNTHPFAHVTKTWEFRDGRMRLSATYTLLREIALNNVYIGMLGIYRRSEGQSDASYLTSRCQKRNHPLSVYNIEDGWWNESYRLELQAADKNCSAITLWGDEGISAEFSVVEPSEVSTSGMFIQHNGGVYNKTYYRAVGLAPQVQEGTEYMATIQWTFF